MTCPAPLGLEIGEPVALHRGDAHRGQGDGRRGDPTSGRSGVAAASVGLVILPTHFAGYRERGVLRRIREAGIPVSAVLLGQVAVALTPSVVGGITPLRPLITAMQDPWFGNGWNLALVCAPVGIGAVA